MHKEIALTFTNHDALVKSDSFAVLSSARFSEFEGENFFPVDAFSKNFFRPEENFPTG